MYEKYIIIKVQVVNKMNILYFGQVVLLDSVSLEEKIIFRL